MAGRVNGDKHGSIVTTEWLAGQLGTPGLVVFDATKYLPNEDKDGKTEYLRGHIPGARFFDIDQVADPTPTCRTWSPRPAGSPS